ncbi:hypothetical protein BH11VER1_BH11VER1_22540 [soil metagenome]
MGRIFTWSYKKARHPMAHHNCHGEIQPGTLLALKRTPSNPHAPLTTMIFTENGHHLGCVPRAKNGALARLMDAGKLIFGKVNLQRWLNEWLKVETGVCLRDISIKH